MSLLGGIELAPLITKVKVDVKGFKSEMEQVKTEAVTKTKEVSKQMEKTIKVGENMSKLGGTMTKALTVPIAGAGVAITKMAVDYETSFAKVSTLLDKNVVDYDKYKNEILDASSKSKIAVGEFSEAVYQSISAGVDQTKAIDFTTEAMKLAKGGFTDGAKAVDVLTTAINVYGMSAEDVTHVSDVLINTQNLGKTTVDELASSIGMVLPITSQLNMSFEDTMAVMATLTKNGIGTSQAVTGLKAALSNVVKPTTEASDAAEVLGIDFSSAALQSKGLIPFLDEIKASMESAAPDFARMSDAVCENRIEMSKLEEQGKKNTDQYKQLKKTTENMEKDMEVLAQASDSTISGFATLFGSVEGLNSMMVLTSETGSKDLQTSMDAMYNSAGAAQTAFEKMDATPAEKLKGALNELKNSGIKLGAKLIPVVTKIADKISDLVDWFNELSPAQQENILKMGGMIAVAGPLLKVTGGLIQGYGKLKPLISGVSTLFSKGAPLVGKFAGKLAESSGLIGKVGGALTKLAPAASSAVPALSGVASSVSAVGGAAATAGGATGLGALASSLGGAAVAAAPFVAAGAAVVATGYGIYKCLSQEVVPEVDLFADGMVDTSIKITDAYGNTVNTVGKQTVKISEATQEGVQAYMDMDDAITQQMYEMKVGSTKITKEIADDMVGKFNQMGDSIITKQKETVNTSLHTLKTFYTETGGTVDAKEQAILDSITTKHNEQVANVEESKRRISEIYQRAADENREITQVEQTEINTIQENMRDTAITTFSETEQEAAVIRERMKDYQSRLSAEMASEMILKANEARDKEKQAAEDKYNGIVKEASKLKQAGLITDEQYKSMVDSAKTAKDEQIKRAEEACSGIKQEIQDATPGIENEVNMQTGSIMDTWDRMCNWVSDKFDWLTGKSEEAQRMAKNAENSGSKLESRTKRRNGSHYNGLDYVPFDGYNARLHEGERVLTKKENEQYTKGKQGIPGGGKIVIDVPLNINDREFAHATKEAFFEELGFDMG